MQTQKFTPTKCKKGKIYTIIHKIFTLFVKLLIRKLNEGGVKMAELTLKIEGMTCHHCVMSVRRAVEGVEGVNNADVDVGSAKINYDDTKTNKNAIIEAIQRIGYRVVG